MNHNKHSKLIKIIRWIRCHIFNKHFWIDCGYTNVYKERQWYCTHCHKIKQKDIINETKRKSICEKIRKF